MEGNDFFQYLNVNMYFVFNHEFNMYEKNEKQKELSFLLTNIPFSEL